MEEIEVMPAPDDDHCCGCCANMMESEDAYGYGWCEVINLETYCGDYCGKFKEQ